MIAVYDLDVRALPAGGDPSRDPIDGGAILARVGRYARFAALCGLDGVGVVGRFSAMHGPGVLRTLQGASVRADDGLIRLDDGTAPVLVGGEIRTVDGVDLVAYGPPADLVSLARAFPTSLFDGFRPRLEDALRAAAFRRLLVLARAWREPETMRTAIGRRSLRGLAGLLTGPESGLRTALARALGYPVAGGTGARRLAEIGARRTALDLDDPTFEGVRRAFAEGAVTTIDRRGHVARVAVEGAAALHIVIENVRAAAGSLAPARAPGGLSPATTPPAPRA